MPSRASGRLAGRVARAIGVAMGVGRVLQGNLLCYVSRMANTTIYIAQPFSRRGRRLVPGVQAKMPSEQDARRRAERLASATGNVGAIAMSLTGDVDSGDFDEPVILARFGETPEPD